jgi:hypothetical protein
VAALISSDTVGASAGERLLDGALTMAEIDRCLATAHPVGGGVFFPVPQPGYVFSWDIISWFASQTDPSDLVISRPRMEASLSDIRRIERTIRLNVTRKGWYCVFRI